MILDIYLFSVLFFKLLLSLVNLLAAMALRKFLTALTTKEALVEKAAGKRKRLVPAAEERASTA